jgi:phenylpyruvate tautomerase PptA (4-oxalocrotonate tautomerase family)
MSQIKIYGIKEQLNPIKQKLSETIHACVVEVLAFPKEKRFHRFFPMEAEDMLYGAGRSNAYTIIEIMMIEGRSVETKKRLIKMLFEQIEKEIGIVVNDIEICIQEAPASHWGFRGMTGDEILLDYKVKV